MLTQPMLVKRPLLERGTLIAVGYSAASYEALIAAP
jgi:arsenate reductase-like glutaredoxin family protein